MHVNDIRLGDQPSPVYQDLRRVVGDREYFVMSSNVDALFTRNGFDHDRVYTPQGDYALYQCLTPCTREVWDARGILQRALDDYDPATGATSEAAVPACPNCAGPVSLNVYAGQWYINDHFQPQLDGLSAWLKAGVAAETNNGHYRDRVRIQHPRSDPVAYRTHRNAPSEIPADPHQPGPPGRSGRHLRTLSFPQR